MDDLHNNLGDLKKKVVSVRIIQSGIRFLGML